MEKVNRHGKTALNMMAIGVMAWLKAKVHFFMQTEMFTLVSFTKIELTALEYMSTPMANVTKAFGKMICKMVLAKKNLKMDLNTMECFKTEKNGVMVHINGRMNLSISGIGLIIILKDKVNIDGLMEGFTRVNGKKTNCMAKEYTRGLMEENTKVNMKMIKNTDKDVIHGQMANPMMVNG
jgi:hypothetical protein